MVADQYEVRYADDGSHTHPYIDADDVAEAKTTTTLRKRDMRDVMGNPFVISHDHTLTCGHRVSEVIPGATYPA